MPGSAMRIKKSGLQNRQGSYSQGAYSLRAYRWNKLTLSKYTKK